MVRGANHDYGRPPSVAPIEEVTRIEDGLFGALGDGLRPIVVVRSDSSEFGFCGKRIKGVFNIKSDSWFPVVRVNPDVS